MVAGRLLLAQLHLVRFILWQNILRPGQLFFQLLGALVFHPAADRNIDRLKLPGIGSISKAKQALFLGSLLALLLGLHIIRNNGHAGAKKVGKIFFPSSRYLLSASGTLRPKKALMTLVRVVSPDVASAGLGSGCGAGFVSGCTCGAGCWGAVCAGAGRAGCGTGSERTG